MMDNRRLRYTALMVGLVAALVMAEEVPAMPGDRFPATDVELRFPEDCFIHNDPSGRVIDVTRLPEWISDHDAYPDGTHPDETTDALLDVCDWLVEKFKATGNVSHHGHLTGYIVYFPAGTYLVNQQIVHRGPVWLRNNQHENLNRLHFYGQGRGQVTIRLADGTPEFGDKSNPRAVLAFTKHDRNNSVSTNALQNLTVDLGRGNPGAIGVDFQGANVATVRNVAVKSGDGDGHAGIRLPIWPTQGYYTDITVDGTDYGIDVVGGMVANGPVFENITLNNQKKVGFRAQTTVTPIRNVLVRDPGGPAVELTTNLGHMLVLDSRFEGVPAGNAGIQAPPGCASLYARNVEIGDGVSCIRLGEKDVHQGRLEGEFVAGEVKALAGASPTSLQLPIKDAPIVPFDPPDKWVSVESTGATGADQTDDTDAIQAALDACDGERYTAVYFRSAGEFVISRSLRVPAGVKRIIFMWGGRINTEQLADGSGHFVVSEASDSPLVFEDYFQHVNGNRGHFIEHASTRTVVVRNVRGSRDFSNYRHSSGSRDTELYLENVKHMLSEGCHLDNVCWARWINTETAKEVEFLNAGGRLWVLGYKCEDSAINFRTTDGGSTEVLGGIVNQYRSRDGRLKVNPAFEVIDARMSVIASTSGPSDRQFETIVREIMNGVTRTLGVSEFPVREGNKVHIPLVVVGKTQ